MNTVQLSNALGKVNDKYILEAIAYERKRSSGLLKWSVLAACFGLILTAVMAALPGISWGPGGIVPPPNPGVSAPAVSTDDEVLIFHTLAHTGHE